MACTLFYRASAIITLCVIAGAVHSIAYNAGSKPIKLQLDEAAPLPLPTLPKPAGTVPATNPGTAATPPTTPPPAAKVSINVTIDEAKALFDQGIIFVDARGVDDYKTGHVLNAFQLTPEAAETLDGQAVKDQLNPAQPIVIYCSGGECDASKNLAKRLQLEGYKFVRIMEDGYPGWQKAGHPTAVGDPVVGGSH